jgi:hypothetical protein
VFGCLWVVVFGGFGVVYYGVIVLWVWGYRLCIFVVVGVYFLLCCGCVGGEGYWFLCGVCVLGVLLILVLVVLC